MSHQYRFKTIKISCFTPNQTKIPIIFFVTSNPITYYPNKNKMFTRLSLIKGPKEDKDFL